jgi:hypothetical protein
VPGNHDRYAGRYLPISNQITNFESVFGDRFGNRGRPRAAGWLTSRDLRLRVLAIDSMGDAGWASVAKGKVHDDDLDWLQTYTTTTRARRTLRSQTPAVAPPCCDPRQPRFNRWTKLKNVTDALESMLRADIDLVMFGTSTITTSASEPTAISSAIAVRRRLTKTISWRRRLITCMCAQQRATTEAGTSHGASSSTGRVTAITCASSSSRLTGPRAP